ncbi:MAG: hypothetical protein QF440_06480 [Candidatus Thalassarchaeaceae archaeon]|jgi:hypothetical protein|nr:hypothetical protein [Candidatus Thalassarchaeaceae archaeon]
MPRQWELQVGENMLNEITEKRLTEMMESLASRAIRRRFSQALDLLCWTPLAPMIRSARRSRVLDQTHQIRMRKKTAEICAEVRENHADLLAPAWA